MIDLSNDLSLTFRLLDDTNAWRHRLVEQVVLGSAEYYTVRRSFQLELSPALGEGFDIPEGVDAVRALVPLATLPKASLLSFDLAGPGGATSALELRRSGAAVEAAYLEALARADGLSGALIDAAFPEALLEAVCAFTPDPFRRIVEETAAHNGALRLYLSDGLGFDIGACALADARRLARWSAIHLVSALHEPADPLSSAENVLLALPLMGAAAPTNDEELVHVVAQFHAGVVVAAALGATAFLSTLAEYGRRWELLTELELRNGSPTIVKMSDRRPLKVARTDRRAHGVEIQLELAIGGALSYHLAVEATDPSLHLLEWRATTTDGEELPPALLEGVKRTPELLTIYTSSTGRPYFAQVATRIGVAASVRWVPVIVACLTSLAAASACFGSSAPDRLGALTVPTTFAVGLLQLRDQVSLVSRIQRPWRRLMFTSMVVLWVVVLVRLLGE